MIRSFVFSEGKLVGQDLEIDALRLVRADKGLVLWVDLQSPTAEETKTILEDIFHFHPLAIEDCVSPDSLPKIEEYEDDLFIVTHAVNVSSADHFETTELDLFLGKDYLVSYHRDVIKPVQAAIDRCTKASGIVARGPDRLAHLVLDLVVDNYKPIIDTLQTKLSDIEETVLGKSSEDLIPGLLKVRKEINHLRKIIRPQREVVSQLAHGDNKIIRGLLLPYFRDLRDKLIRIDETAATYADQLLISFDLYLSKSDFQANEGIKALTAITALTLPATMIGTWYGMNFEHMPELKSPYGYPTAFIVTLVLTAAMAWWCKKKRWI